ncbi:MAG: carbonic anhydrase [Thiohalomonadales bacterium]
MKKNLIVTLGIAGAILAAGVHAGSGHHSKNHWGYKGLEGPEQWAKLSTEYSTCGTGTRQSPIDLAAGLLQADMQPISFNYSPVAPEIVNNGHTIQLNYKPGSSISVAGKSYELLQFHFHSPSENTVSGKPFDMEMHLVHQSKQGELAVVAVFIRQGKENHNLKAAWENMPSKAGAHKVLSGVSLNAKDLLPSDKAYSHFKGSLTTPPCSEGVNWFVLNKPIEVSTKQLAKFIDVIGPNARPVQNLNDRFVLKVSSK